MVVAGNMAVASTHSLVSWKNFKMFLIAPEEMVGSCSPDPRVSYPQQLTHHNKRRRRPLYPAIKAVL